MILTKTKKRFAVDARRFFMCILGREAVAIFESRPK